MRKTVWILGAVINLVAAPAMALDGDSVSLNPDQLPWARWQGRLSLGNSAALPTRPGFDTAARPAPASLMGDYYFGRSLVGLGRAGGFRATSGLIFGPRSTLATGQPSFAAGNTFSIGSRLFGQPALPLLRGLQLSG